MLGFASSTQPTREQQIFKLITLGCRLEVEGRDLKCCW